MISARSRATRASFVVSAVSALAIVTTLFASPVVARATGDVASVDAAARAAGNRKATAIAIGRRLFATVRPVQILKVRVDGIGSHEVAGLVLSGRKFHGPVDAGGIAAEIVAIVDETFGASDVEEVDVWITVPIAVGEHAVVAGDKAMPTTRIVYATTVLRADRATLAARLRAGTGVYWYAPWKSALR